MRKLYRFDLDCGRMGNLSGIFAADDWFMEQYVFGYNVSFGEVLGKHSDINSYIDDKFCKILTDDQEFINKAIEYGLVPTGINLLDYIEPIDSDLDHYDPDDEMEEQ